MYILKLSDSAFRHICSRGNVDTSILVLVQDTLFITSGAHAHI